jgi:hypothetical protein
MKHNQLTLFDLDKHQDFSLNDHSSSCYNQVLYLIIQFLQYMYQPIVKKIVNIKKEYGTNLNKYIIITVKLSSSYSSISYGSLPQQLHTNISASVI